jgi:hypothetical protein
MTRKKRTFTTFSLSFLDIMSCGFGAVVLVFLIMDHAMEVQSKTLNHDLLSEVDFLNDDIAEGQEGLVRLRNTLSDIDLQVVDAQGLATRILETTSEYEAMVEALKQEGFTERSDIDAIKAEIQSLEEEIKKLEAAAQANSGINARSYIGEGNRQYLTGLNLGGRNVAILMDASSSMLADKLINILRLRNMGEKLQRSTDKWTRALSTVDWLTAQLPVSSKYQVITFNTEAKTALPNTAGQWLEVANQDQLVQVSQQLRKLTPGGGTNLANAFRAVTALSPLPDNIFLITDGLPTQGDKSPRGSKISGKARRKLYREAVKLLPRSVPVNIILFPMEGDPMAASEFWQLAQKTQGAFMSPSRDWP